MKVSLSTSLSISLLSALVFSQVSLAQDLPIQKTDADSFLAAHGDSWRVAPHPFTGEPSFVYGGRYSLNVAPRNTRAFEAAARIVVDQNQELFGFDSSSLELRQVKELNLSRIGSSDKIAVIFNQVVEGIRVLGGSASILFDAASGDVIGLDTTGVSFAQNISLLPGSSASDAVAAAEAAYAVEFGVNVSSIDDMDVVIVGPRPFFGRKSPLTDRGATLAYEITLSTPGFITSEGLPAQGRVYVSAEGDLTVFKVEHTAHSIDGNISGNANTGQEPNTTSNQEQPGLQNLWIRQNNSSGSILGTTDANGNYNLSQTGPLTLFAELRGPYCNVENDAGADSSSTLSGASGSGNDVVFNPSNAEFPTAEVAGFYWVNVFREWVVSVDPSDSTMDFSVTTNVNKNDLTCNAYFNGNSINLERADGSCANTCYNDVVIHEEGHYANAVYQGGGISGAFHEGNADNYAYYINDEPCLNHFIGNGCLRSALQTSIKKCPTDGDESCNGGQSHAEGQALASAVWAVRDNLNTTHGNNAGDAIADALFNGWMNAYNDSSILNIIQDHWLVLDDDNGDLSDGTPNMGDINSGFASYGWPAPPDLSIIAVNIPATNAEIGHLAPVSVTANVTSAQGAISGVTAFYSTNNGSSFSSVAMSATGTANEFQGSIPGVVSPNSVQWYIRATSSAGGVSTLPTDAPNVFNLYHVGDLVILANYGFDGGSDEGWTHVNLSGSSGDQWHRADPGGSNESTDPGQAYSPSNVWGTDLSVPGWDGKYEPNGSGDLLSPTFDMSTSSSVRLQYRRWLAVEEGIFDQAEIRVNNSVVWQNAPNGNHIDSSWALHDLDISSIAAGNSSVQVGYRLTSDGGVEFGGWNIDDFMLYRVDAVSCPVPVGYGSPDTGTNGVQASISYAGNPVVGDPNFALTTTGFSPNNFGVLFSGDGVGGNVQSWGIIFVAGPNFMRTYFTTDALGEGAVSIPVTSALVGITRNYQFVARDPLGPFGDRVQHTGALAVTFCP